MVGSGGQKMTTLLPHLLKTLGRRTTSPAANLPDQALPSLRRAFSLYDQINLIDNVPEDQLRFQRYTDSGFTINGVEYEGSLLLIEILILGCGRYIQPVSPEVRQFIRSAGMKLEPIDSRNAASTYNILNEEGRVVAAALLPYGVTS